MLDRQGGVNASYLDSRFRRGLSAKRRLRDLPTRRELTRPVGKFWVFSDHGSGRDALTVPGAE